MSIGDVALWTVGFFGAGVIWEGGKAALRTIRKADLDKAAGLASGSDVLVVSPSYESSAGEPNTPTTYEDAMAQAEVMVAFHARGIQVRAATHRRIHESDLACNLVLICGPGGNTVTAKLLETRQLPIDFVEARGVGWTIQNRASGEVYRSATPGSDDYGLVARLKNPWSPALHRVLLLAGIEGLGTWAAAHLLATEPRALLRHLNIKSIAGKDSEFVAVLHAHWDSRRTPRVGLRDVVRL